MSKPFDYSKWDNIELSDDEDDVHPNIDRESWFRMKHRSRVEREEKEDMEKKKICAEMDTANLRITEINRTLKSIADEEDSDDELEDVDGLQAELTQLEQANQLRQDKLDEFEKNKKWNVDNMCQVVEERTIVNPKAGESRFSEQGYVLPDKDGIIEVNGTTTTTNGKKVEEEIEEKFKNLSHDKDDAPTATKTTTDISKETSKTTTATSTTSSSSTSAKEEVNPSTKPAIINAPAKPKLPNKQKAGPTLESISMLSYHEFTEKYAELIEQFMTIKSLEKSRNFLLLHGDVMLQENASNYLLLASLEDEMNGFRDKMRLTARQSQLISNIAELAKSLKAHPGNVIMPFFQRLEQKEHLDGFNAGLETFVQNLIKRAIVKRKEMNEAEAQEEALEEGTDLKDIPKEERLGPGGLDPVEVFESLPESMQEAFESRDTDMLKKALMEMSPDEAENHMKQCVESGLWNEG